MASIYCIETGACIETNVSARLIAAARANDGHIDVIQYRDGGVRVTSLDFDGAEDGWYFRGTVELVED